MSPMPDSTLADAEQGIADLQRQLAECRVERDEALQRETATAEVLQVINSSPGDLAPVFDAMLERAMRLCEAEIGTLWISDGERSHAVASRGAPPAYAEFLNRGPHPRPTRTRGIVHIPDVRETEFYRDGNPLVLAGADLGGVRTMLAVPLRKDEVVLGRFSIYRQEVRPFTEKQISLLQNFAAQAVIAMENARLITETHEALEQQTATAEVLRVINSSPGDLAPVFDAILEKARSLCGAALGTLMARDGARFHALALHRVPEGFAEVLREGFEPHPNSPIGRLLSGETLIHLPDLAEYARTVPQDPVPRTAVEIGGVRTLLMVPLQKDNALLGVITAFRQEVRPFSDKQIALLQNFAAQAVVAMENARLITETREALEQQTATADVLQVINSSPGDLTTVFDAVLEKTMRLCEAAFGQLDTYDGRQFRTVALRGVPAAFSGHLGHGSRVYSPGTGPARMLAGERVLYHRDLKDEDVYRNGDPHRRALVDLGGARTSLQVALVKDETFLGFITLFRQEVRPFTQKQTVLLQNFAAQAVIAMENARLLGELRQRTDEIAAINRDLEVRVAAQVEELGRVGRLKRFLAPQLAKLIVSQGDEKILESHRREIVVVFCDLRGYTAFTETAEPEEVLDFLREYHGALGPLVSQYEGTLDQFSGDGIMVFFNDPVPCSDPAERAVKMAMAMREAAGKLIAAWRRHGSELGFGAGIAQGYATLGQIGFSDRSGYTAIGTVCNLAARLCAEAKDGQILVSSRIAEAVEAVARLEDLGNLELRGLRRPVAAFNVVQSTSAAEPRPNLTVVARETGP
jgi:class 3 adenylate cyclase